jgi:outer membrane protein assembly factor BamD (BamD/ComL family)
MRLLTKLLSVCALLLCASPSLSQQSFSSSDAGEFEPASDDIAVAKRKHRSIFHRPNEESPAQQLAYAETLEAEGRLRSAKSEYNSLVHHWHNSPEAPIAQFGIARILYEQEKYEKAFETFQYLVDYFAGRFKYNEVIDYQFRIANQMVGNRWGDVLFLPGFKAPERALPMLSKVIANAPNLDKAASARLSIGMIQEETKSFEEAIATYDAVGQYHKGSAEAEKAAFRRVACLYILSDKAPRDEKRCRAALSATATFLARHKQSVEKEQAETYLATLKLRLEAMYYDRAQFYDEIAKRPASALIAYRDFLKKFPASDHARGVLERIEALELQVTEK